MPTLLEPQHTMCESIIEILVSKTKTFKICLTILIYFPVNIMKAKNILSVYLTSFLFVFSPHFQFPISFYILKIFELLKIKWKGNP